jgi:hypothetical protein
MSARVGRERKFLIIELFLLLSFLSPASTPPGFLFVGTSPLPMQKDDGL